MKTIIKNMYKENIIKGLKKVFNIEVDESSLISVLSPQELREIIDKYSIEDFSLGNPFSEDLNENFKNVIDGNFRITLHNHTYLSDGRISPEDFINMAAKYADKVASKIKPDDKKPPFVIALTDHDEVRGCQEIIKLIAQNPDRYKNVKFVAGGELGAKIDDNYFDITALAINPFDENLNKFLDNQKETRTITVNELIRCANEIAHLDYTLEQLREMNFKDKTTLKRRSGMVYISDTKKLLIKLIKEKYGENNTESKDFIKRLSIIYDTKKFAYKDLANAEDIFDIVKNSFGLTSWTHPIRSFKNNDDLKWHEQFLEKLHSMGIDGVEANHQYTGKQLTDIKLSTEKCQLYRDLAKYHKMFVSGGTDSHEFDIFGHHHIIDETTLAKMLG